MAFSIAKSYLLVPLMNQDPSKGFTGSGPCCVTVAGLSFVLKMRHDHADMVVTKLENPGTTKRILPHECPGASTRQVSLFMKCQHTMQYSII